MALTNGSHQGAMAKFLPRINIAQMDFDNRRFDGGEGVAQRNRVMRKRAGVDDDAVGLLRLLLEKVDERALVVGLEALHADIQFLAALLQHGNDLRQRDRAIDGRFACSKRVEIRPVYHENVQHGVFEALCANELVRPMIPYFEEYGQSWRVCAVSFY